MSDRNDHIRRKRLQKRLATIILLLTTMYLLVIGLTSWQTVSEANRIDAERSERAVTATVASEIKSMASLAKDYGIWDDATTHFYENPIDPVFAWSNMGVETGAGGKFSEAAILDANGATRIAYQNGQRVETDFLARFGVPLQTMVRRIGKAGAPIAGIAPIKDKLYLIGVSNILPTSSGLGRIIPPEGPRRLFVARELDRNFFAFMGTSLMLSDLVRSNEAQSSSHVALRGIDGATLGYISWTPGQPGLTALKWSLPWMALGILVHLLLAGYAIRQGIRLFTELGNQASTDSLTQLPNRRALREALGKHRRNKSQIALAMLDLDGFKSINDLYGHQIGDRMLVRIADRLREICGSEALVVRLGGDEFAILVNGNDAKDHLERVVKEVLRSIPHPIRLDDRTIMVGVSIGLVESEARALITGEILRRADMAMYAAKKAGKLRFVWYSPRLEQARESALKIEYELRDAITRSDFSVVYQPVVSCEDYRIVGVEAFLRWTRRDGSPVSPSQFIPVAEETGQIDQLGMVMVRQLCRDSIQWRGTPVSINVSAMQLRNPEFVYLLGKELKAGGLAPELVTAEIEESFFHNEPEIASRVVAALRTLKTQVVIDNFGSGATSLSLLQKITCDRVKIDHSLMARAETDETARVILQSVIGVAKSMGIGVVAEGVETQGQADMMRVAGADFLQGWYFAKPTSAIEFAKLRTAVTPSKGAA
jgi:diguanylate cyclase (GGDEF)-like protein